MHPIIEVNSISKQYRLGTVGTGSLSHDINRLWSRLWGKGDPYLKIGETNDRSKKGESEYVWALRDISFTVMPGEVLGIIGRNGAGKSTLLKILSRITTPTTGSIKLRGRVASLLEVGTGMHPELTGRENIYLNGAILGMRKKEIDRKLDEIVDFSGVERYLDTPVKRYSSGMHVRLGFAVAAHLEPEILIVDEVLAVGDAEFQKRCLGKMKDVSANEGRTVLFVSHNLTAIRKIAERALLVEMGTLVNDGSMTSIIEKYLATNIAKSFRKDVPANLSAGIIEVQILNQDDKIDISEEIVIGITYQCNLSNLKLSLSLALFTIDQSYVLNSPSGMSEKKWSLKTHDSGQYYAEVKIPGNFLNTGNFYPWILLIEDGIKVIDEVKEKLSLEIFDKNISLGFTGFWGGVVRPNLEWKIQNL